jgi:4-amino-4-deoxy-L-arabinose transferase-like glycosyltransferase
MSSTLIAEQRTVIVYDESVPARRSQHNVRAWLTNPWFVAAVAFAARLAYMLILKTWDIRTGQNHFAFGYETGSIARSIAAGHGFASPFRNVDTGPTAWIAPSYPYFCALVFKLLGTFTAASAVVILGVNSLFSALLIVPLMRIAERLFSRATAITTAWIWALVPYFMCWPASWVWEAGVSAFLVVALVGYGLDLPEATARRWLCFGALGGVAILTNPALLTFLPVISLWAVWRSRSRSVALQRAVIAGLMCVAVISPWLVRNRVVMGQWVFLRDNFAFEFTIGNYPGGSGMGWAGLHPAVNDRIMKEYKERGELAFLAARADYPRRFVTEHRDDFVRETVHRFTAFWDGTSLNWTRFAEDIWQPLPFFAVTLAALFGWVLAMRGRMRRYTMADAPDGAWMLGLCCLLYPWPYYITYVQTRYRHAIEPLLVMLGAYLLVSVAQGMRGQWKLVWKFPASS